GGVDVMIFLKRFQSLVRQKYSGVRSKHRPALGGLEPLDLAHRVEQGGVEGHVGDVRVVDVIFCASTFSRQKDSELTLLHDAEQINVNHSSRQAVMLIVRPADPG